MDGPLQRGAFLAWERRAMGCIESAARPQSRGAQRYGRPASAGRVPRVGTAGDGVHRKQSPSTEPWRAAVWTARFSGEGSSCGNGGRWGASKAQPVHRAVVRSGMDGPLQRGGLLVWERRAMGCIGSRARPQSRGAQRYGRPASAGRVPRVGTAGDGVHRKRSPSTEPWCAAVWTACFSGEGSSCGNGGRWGASEMEPVHRAVVRLRHGRPASAGRVPCARTAGDGVHRKRSPSTERWCACRMDGPLQRGAFLVREQRAIGCIESGARPQSGGVHAVWTARFSGERSSCENSGR